MTKEEFNERALDIIYRAAYDLDVKEEATRLWDELVESEAKYKVGDKVWVLISDYRALEVRVSYVGRFGKSGRFYYSVEFEDENGHHRLRVDEPFLFKTKEELLKRLTEFIKENE